MDYTEIQKINIYFVKFNIKQNDEIINIFKIGITTNLNERIESLKNEFSIKSDFVLLLAFEVRSFNIETKLLLHFKTKYPKLKYDFKIRDILKTECFLFDEILLEELIEIECDYKFQTNQEVIKDKKINIRRKICNIKETKLQIKLKNLSEAVDKKEKLKINLDKETYTSHEYYKYIIKNTFNDIELINSDKIIKLISIIHDIELVNSDKMLEFIDAVHDNIYNHNNFMILRKYGIDKTIYLHYMSEFSKLFIPKSKVTSEYLFSHRKSLEFIKKYNITEYINKHSNIDPKEFKINNKEFIEWFNSEDNIFYKIGNKDIERIITTKINNLLKIHGLTIISKRIRLKTTQKQVQINGERKKIKIPGKRERKYYILTLIDYELFNIDLTKIGNEDLFVKDCEVITELVK